MKIHDVVLQLSLLTILIPAVGLAQSQEKFEKAKQFYEAGNLANARGDFVTAIERYTQAISLYPKVPEFFFNRAIAYRHSRKFDQAIEDFDRLLELKPNLPISRWAEFHYARGTVFQEKGDYADALDNLEKAISLNSNNPNYYNSRANTYLFMKKYDLALEDFNRSLEMHPQSVTFYNRARLYNERGEFTKAIGVYTKAVELDPQYSDAFNNRGLAYERIGDLDRALMDFTKAVSLASNDGVYYFNRANVYFRKGNLGSSITDYTRAVDIFPRWAEAYRRRADAYRKLGRNKLAKTDLQKAKQVEKENFSPIQKTEIVMP